VETHKNISQGSWSVDRDYTKVTHWLNWAALLVQISCLVNGATAPRAAAAPTAPTTTTTEMMTTKAKTGHEMVH
jgi:hypothetical protein